MARKPAAPRQPETATATRAGEADREARYQFSAIAEQPASLVRLRSARHGSGGAAEGLTILTNLTVPCTDRRWPVGLEARGRRAFRMGGRGIWRGCPFCEACEPIAAGDSVEQAAPHCKDPSRSPDPSTLRRWAHRRLLSVCGWVRAGAVGAHFLRAPTILGIAAALLRQWRGAEPVLHEVSPFYRIQLHRHSEAVA